MKILKDWHDRQITHNLFAVVRSKPVNLCDLSFSAFGHRSWNAQSIEAKSGRNISLFKNTLLPAVMLNDYSSIIQETRALTN